MCSIGRIIKESSGMEADFFKSIVNKCNYYIDTCMNRSSNDLSNKNVFM